MRYRPILLVALFSLMLGLIPTAGRPTPVGAASYTPDSQECAFLALVNDYRVSKGRLPLKLSPTLGAAADYHSRDMASKNYFSHTLANGTSWDQNIRNYGYPSGYFMSENIAAGNETAQRTFEQWKNSSGHNANMLSQDAKAIGIGRAYGASARYRWYWTTTFGGKVDATVLCPGYVEPNPPAGTEILPVGTGRTGMSVHSGVIIDGKTSTSWYTTWDVPRTAGYVWVDLGSTMRVGTVKFYFSRSSYADRYHLQISTDKVNWTKVVGYGSARAGTWRTAEVGKDARYVRIYIENPNGDAQVGYLAELKVYT